ncbi:hypothetical protein Hbl1158_02820 [Halobaculum sp. CBA1158]|nr:hypothetical protein Hbl1158_02820 [Halobaculum sp. CBA1158]
MGDGCVQKARRDGGHASMTVSSTNERWLRWLFSRFGERLAVEPVLKSTGAELQENAAKYPKFDNSGGEWEYSDIYMLRIRAHPALTQIREEWYPDDTIRYPSTLDLNPTITKAWYCSDGGLSWSDREHAFAAFGTHNEADRAEFLCRLFRIHGFDPNWSEPLVRFDLDGTKQLLSWMGPAPPGFEYKWEHRSREQYDELKQEVTA